ncbi:hypothetical protein EPUL_006392, partial [Erysiphe pulchra]
MAQSLETPLSEFFLGDKKKKSQYFDICGITTSFGGRLLNLEHINSTTDCKMDLNLYLPNPNLGATCITTTTIIETADSGTIATTTNLFNSNGTKFPVLIFLADYANNSGDGADKSFLQLLASQKGIAIVYPDTSPRKEVFTSYLGSYGKHMEKWKMNDATELVKRWLEGPFPCLIDVGTSDELYLTKQLLPEKFAEAANMSGVGRDLVIRYQE